MKSTVFLLVLAAIAGCHKADDPAPDDPLLGLWKAEQVHYYRYDGRGNLATDSVVTNDIAIRVERDTVKNYHNGYYVQRYAYKRTGEAIYIPQLEASGKLYNTWYVRSLTSTSFIREDFIPYRGSTRQVTYYHR